MKILLTLIFSISLLIGASADKKETSGLEIVATVNGTVITKNTLDRAVASLIPQTYYHASVSPEKMKTVQKEALESVIKKILLYQYAQKENITVTKDEVNEVEAQIMESFKTQELFEKALKMAKIDYKTFKHELEVEMVIKKLFDERIRVDLTDKELLKYYNKNKQKFKEPEKIKLSLIYIRNDPTDANGTQKAKKRAEEAYEKIKSGEEFALIAERYSHDASRVKGGDMGFLHRGRLDNKEVEDVAFSMKQGTMSKVIESDIGYFIVKVDDKKLPNQLSFEQIKKKLRDDLKKRTEKERKENILERLKKEAKIVRSL